MIILAVVKRSSSTGMSRKYWYCVKISYERTFVYQLEMRSLENSRRLQLQAGSSSGSR